MTSPNLTEDLARRAIERSTGDRKVAYAHEIERIIEATYQVIEKTGSFDPSLREILKLTKLSTQTFYRYFQSKDELLVVVLDDGRRQIVDYLKHRMSLVSDPQGQVRAWIEGVLAQAKDPVAASRTRPFVVSPDRLVEAFPAEMRTSRDRLIEILAEAIGRIRGAVGSGYLARRRGRLPPHLRNAARALEPAVGARPPTRSSMRCSSPSARSPDGVHRARALLRR